MKKYYMIGNTHFDPVWLWRWDEAMAAIRATFRSALERMNENPNFIYSFATPPVFDWIRRTEPEMFAQIQERVREGRWELAEGWWVQPDCYGASGESYVRQGLYGQRYLMEHFGKTADCVFNIDSFGHSPALPQILSKSGIRCYCFVRPEAHHILLQSSLFRWQGIDGSQILTYRADRAYAQELTPRLKASYDGDDELIVYGVTDHGGAPTKKSIAEIEASEHACFSTVSGFFEKHDTDYTVTQELLTGDFGPYANYSKVKKLNRIAEYAVLNAEKASLIADRYDNAAITACWKDILFNQFHDILGGACIKDAYIDAENMLGRAIMTANELMHTNLQIVTSRIQMPGKNPDTVWNLVVWNLNGKPYDGYIEAEVQWGNEFPWYMKGICLEDTDGVQYPCQVIREKSVCPGFRSRFIFRAKIPAVGYKVFKLLQTDEEVRKKQADPYRIMTDRLTVTFDQETGSIKSVCDACSGKMLGKNMLVPICYSDKGDTWAFNIKTYEPDGRKPVFEGFRVIEAGENLTEIKANYNFGISRMDMYYRFYKDADYFDVRYRVNWEDAHMVLKLETDIDAPQHMAAVPAGAIARGENPADVPLGAWIKADGISFAPNAMFAYNFHENKLGLTVLRSPIHGDMRITEIDETLDYDIVDRGIVDGGIRIAFGDDPWRIAEDFNNPPIIIDESNHGGTTDAQGSFCEVYSEHVVLSALKRCEDDATNVIRLIETAGKPCDAEFMFRNGSYTVQMQPYEIKTLKLSCGKAEEVNLLEL